ncbi:MAG TPA: heme o synthase [Gemmataceae bacterium]|jgi:protoheme IX farnesyltransferase|nr:heme o synthase [Gemmataceae bacterium]
MKSCAQAVAVAGGGTRVADFVELTKPRIALLVLFTVAAGALLAQGGLLELGQLFHTLLGTGLVAAGASALNQLLERHSDALMQRTENRPLPAGRLQPAEVFLFGIGLGVGGLIYLALAVRQPLTVLVAAFTFVTYVFLYTPLKRKTTLNTLVGAVPGALPPVIGWTAVTGRLDAGGIALFLILFLWQVPHFLAIAWIYRDDYARAGLRMLPVIDSQGAVTGRQMLLYCLALIPVSLLPVLGSQAGLVYAAGALALGSIFLHAVLGFCAAKSTHAARKVLRASLLYLPVLLALLLLESWLNF